MLGLEPLDHIARRQPPHDQLALKSGALLEAFALSNQLGQVVVGHVAQGLGVGVHSSSVWRPV